jgi:hypothetical protein
MGTTTFFDIVASFITFGLLMLASFRLNQSSTENTSAYYANYMLQTNMLTLTLMLETDLRDIGKSYTRTNANPTPIRTAATNEFSFMVGPDQIDWIVSGPIGSGPNPAFCYVNRNVNGVPFRMNLGVVRMTFKYWNITSATDSMQAPVAQTNYTLIGPVDVSIQLESQYKQTQEYMKDVSEYEMYWRQIRSVARSTLVQNQ